MSDKTLQNMRRRLERWELNHLREHAAELHERLEREQQAREQAERDAAAGWEAAEFWREDAMNLAQALMEEGHAVGLTQAGELVPLKDDLRSDAEMRNDSVEQVDGLAHEDHAVTVTGSSHDHSDSSADRLGGLDVDPMNAAGKPSRFEVGTEQTDAFIPGIGNCAGIEVADDHGHAEALATGANSQDGQLNAIDRRQQGATDLHEHPSKVTWPGESETTTPIDWSPLAGRPVIFHPDKGQDKP